MQIYRETNLFFHSPATRSICIQFQLRNNLRYLSECDKFISDIREKKQECYFYAEEKSRFIRKMFLNGRTVSPKKFDFPFPFLPRFIYPDGHPRSTPWKLICNVVHLMVKSLWFLFLRTRRGELQIRSLLRAFFYSSGITNFQGSHSSSCPRIDRDILSFQPRRIHPFFFSSPPSRIVINHLSYPRSRLFTVGTPDQRGG